MQHRSTKDIGFGLALLVSGAAIAAYAASHYRLGTPANMGPGMFPTGVGVVVAGLGGLIALGGALGTRRPAEGAVRLDVRATVAVLAAIASFALTVATFGLFPAICVMVGISSRADTRLKPLPAAILAVVLCAFAYAVFHLGLGLPWPLLRWPF